MNQDIDDLQSKIGHLWDRVLKIAEELIFNSDFRREFDLRYEAWALHVQIGHYTRALRKAERVAAA
jgi:hypothetical protein